MTTRTPHRSTKEIAYGVSWSNPTWSHLLCAANVLDYFCDLSNPFYDRQCNNEIIRMQRLSSEQLLCMTGTEFYLYQAQEPILFVIRKQQRLSNTQVTPLAYFYIINGTVLQAPDVATLLNSRLLTTINGLNKILQTLAPCARYHPSDGSYSWDDPNTLLGLNVNTEIGSMSRKTHSAQTGASSKTDHSTPTSLFQVQRTDFLLSEWASRFPLPSAFFTGQSQASASAVPISTPSNNPTGLSTLSVPTTVKEEASADEGSHRLPRAPLKTPDSSTGGPVTLSTSSTVFSPSPQSNKKSRVN
ncbi:unnamed protein product [Dicrocoelium dendriticum]|nr:unnamed protein product [Dicrocoelium dendriticum]